MLKPTYLKNNFCISFTDIQEFYELTLLDDSKSIQQKTAETLLIASKWEQDNAIKTNEVKTALETVSSDFRFLRAGAKDETLPQ